MKKIVAVLLILILIFNLFGVITGRIEPLAFWTILIVGLGITYLFFPKEEKHKSKKRK